MPVPIQLLTKPEGKYKLDRKSLEAKFGKDFIQKGSDIDKLITSIQDKIRSGIERNRRDYRLFKAMDWAYDQPFYQVSYTQLRGLLDHRMDDKKVMERVNSWGLTHLLPDIIGTDGKCCTDPVSNKPLKAVNLPVFFNIFVPIVMAYITIRWAKLFNDRNVVPHFKYEPVQYTKENRIRCEIITQIIQRQASWFDYPADTKQTILQTLLYGMCVNFPREAWFVENQLDEAGKKIICKEGLRFDMPHPSRIYYDQYSRLSSLNSNSGCCYAGFWELKRYGEVSRNPLYWNKDKISFGKSADWFDLVNSDFLQQVFPCAMSFPSSASTGSLDRETAAAEVYNGTHEDAAALLTTHFERLIPNECGLGPYEYPVWFRFKFASDNAVLWAEPLAFDRFPTYAYDADFNRARFRSMALEIMPFQDHVGNLLSQWILAVRQNLINPIFYDKDKLPKEAVKILENSGQKLVEGNSFIPFSSTENWKINVDQKEAFHQPQFARHNTSELASLISAVLDMLGRIMLFSPQEVGQAATHEQTAEENKIIASNTTTRVEFTGSFIDDGDYAKKVMMYDALMAYGDEEITVGISSALADSEEDFKKLADKVGFTISDKSHLDQDQKNPNNAREITIKKSALRIENFASTRDKANRIDNAAVADAMSKIFIAIAGNPGIITAIGTPQLVELLNQIIVTAGLPKEFKLRAKNIDLSQPPEQQAQQVSQMLEGLAAQVKQAIDQSAQATLQAAGEQTAQIVGQAMTALNQQLTPMVEAVAQANQVNQLQQQQLDGIKSTLEGVVTAVAQMTPPPPITEQVLPPPPVGVPA